MQIYHVCELYKVATTSIILTEGRFYSPRKASGARPVTDRRSNVCLFCFIGYIHFGFEKIKITVY